MKRKNLLYITVFFLSLSTNAQTIEGVYKVDDIKLQVADIGETYSFENGTFRHTIHEHIGQKTISGGNYELVGDTIKLNYIRLKATPPNPINIIKREKLKSSSDTSFNPMFSNIKVFNSEGKPQPGVYLVLQNEDKKPVMAFGSDSTGNFPNVNIYDKYIKQLQFSFLAHQEAYIKTDSLFNYSTDIEVRLNQSVEIYENVERTFTYLIINRTSERIELVSPQVDHKEKLILIKAKL